MEKVFLLSLEVMKTAAIIGDGEFPKKDFPRYLLASADIVICCDGALKPYLRNMESVFGKERYPDAIVGDMDSISLSLRKRFRNKIIQINEQDDNDQTKAVRHLLGNFPGVKEIHILGATGKREDHTVGNMSLLMEYGRLFGLQDRGISIDMVSDYSTSFPVWDSIELHVGKGRKVSIFSPDNSLNMVSEGLEYQTSGVVFDNWWKATLNKATDDVVRLTFSHPSMALITLD